MAGKFLAYLEELHQYFSKIKRAFYDWLVALYPPMKRWNPNAVSRFRIYLSGLLASTLPLIFYQPSSFLINLALISVGIISDGLDGYLVDVIHKGQGSKNGKWLDSFADKIFVMTILFSIGLGTIWLPFFWLFMALEFFLMAMGATVALLKSWATKKNIQVGSNKFGKWKFTFEGLLCLTLVVYLMICHSFLLFYLPKTRLFLYYLIQLLSATAIILAAKSIQGHLTPPKQ